jgi:uncharacterized repeat protein (TIGR03803 family)
MRRTWALSITLSAALMAVLAGVALAADGVVHVFKNSPDGDEPIAPLTTDSRGNLYGTTHFGGAANEGTVFELSPDSTGHYTYTELYSFAFGAGDAEQPDGGPLLVDGSGNLFGTTMLGGTNGVGAVYELSPVAGGGWNERVIYSFSDPCCSTDGFYPLGGVVMDAAGNLYGATDNGGTHDVGTVFKLSPDGGGGWTESILYSFTGSRNNGPDGAGPVAGVAFDAAGNLYGTTALGGKYLNGIVFELSPGQGGTWTEKVLHAFNGTDGCNPAASLVVDSAGKVYGTTSNLYVVTTTCIGGGTVFRLSPSSSGWTETVLHKFPNGNRDGDYPNGIILDSTGNIYGTTWLGGKNLYGEIYKLTPTASGPWIESVVHAFTGGSGGGLPVDGVIFGIDGALYGTTSSYGGPNGKGGGTVFRNQP